LKAALKLMERRTNFKVFASAKGHVKYTRLPDRTYLPLARTEEEFTKTISSIGRNGFSHDVGWTRP
jgi:hypothetical protein